MTDNHTDPVASDNFITLERVSELAGGLEEQLDATGLAKEVERLKEMVGSLSDIVASEESLFGMAMREYYNAAGCCGDDDGADPEGMLAVVRLIRRDAILLVAKQQALSQEVL